MIALEIVSEASGWDGEPGLPELLRRAAAAAAAALPAPMGGEAVATVLLADDEMLRGLNRDWRGQDKATNVLSFPAPPTPEIPRGLGDVALAFETVVREAAAEGKPLRDHAAHLVVHGLLHLLGYDHDDDREAARMEAIEVLALARIGIADPYRALAA